MKILDACCGGKMFWFDKDNPNVTFMDNRELETELCDGRKFEIKPDIIGDFRDMPFSDNEFDLVVFDPPHLEQAGKNSWLAIKYGVLNENWEEDIRQGFSECFRVLREKGILVFKWSENQIKVSKVINLAGKRPLFGQRRGQTHWLVFAKEIMS